MQRETKILIAVPNRPDKTYKDAANMLALVVPNGATVVSESILVSNQGTGVWAPFSVGQFPNLFPNRLAPDPPNADGSRLIGYMMNNRDEELARFIQVTFIWEGTGPDIAQTSTVNKHPNSPPLGEGVSVAFSVPLGTAPIPITETFAENLRTAPFGSNIPGELRVSHRVPLSFPPGFQALTDTLGLMNGNGAFDRFARLTAHITG